MTQKTNELSYEFYQTLHHLSISAARGGLMMFTPINDRSVIITRLRKSNENGIALQ